MIFNHSQFYSYPFLSQIILSQKSRIKIQKSFFKLSTPQNVPCCTCAKISKIALQIFRNMWEANYENKSQKFKIKFCSHILSNRWCAPPCSSQIRIQPLINPCFQCEIEPEIISSPLPSPLCIHSSPEAQAIVAKSCRAVAMAREQKLLSPCRPAPHCVGDHRAAP